MNVTAGFVPVSERFLPPITRTLTSLCRLLCLGDHLRINRQGIYDHHMLVIEAHSHDSFKVIHYTSLVEQGPGHKEQPRDDSSGRDVKDRRRALGAVVEETLTVKEEDLKNMQVLGYPEGVRLFSVEESISRARSRLNEEEYNVITNNCESFVNWAVTGDAVSYQIVSGTAAALKGAAKHAVEAYGKGSSLLGVMGNGLLGAVAGYLEQRNSVHTPAPIGTCGNAP